ncbi:hypothetical protein [Metamycoplasma hominis]
MDFFSLYSKTYEIRDENLNGDCSFMISDLTIQRNLKKISAILQVLVLLL